MYDNLHGVSLYLGLSRKNFNHTYVLVADDIKRANIERKTFDIHCWVYGSPRPYIDYTVPRPPLDEGIFDSVDIECRCNDDGTISVTGCNISLTRRYATTELGVYIPDRRCDTIDELVNIVHHLHDYTVDHTAFHIENCIDYHELSYDDPGFYDGDYGIVDKDIDNLIVDIDAMFNYKFLESETKPLLK